MPDEAAAASEHGKHGREQYFIEGEGSFATAGARRAADEAPPFRFSRVGPRGKKLDASIRSKVARAMTSGPQRDGRIPAGFTYLGQFVDHDLTFDATTVAFGENITPADLLQGRSPTLDLDSLYGFGPDDEVSKAFYEADRTHLKVGTTTRIGSGNLRAREGFDVPRVGTGNRPRRANIPDRRNDENLAVAQHHAAFIRFHNRVVDRLPASVPAADRFRQARRLVVLHYQWMLKTDYLTRIVDPAIVTDVFANGRKVFEVGADPFSMPTMPVEFSVGAFRLGHSMVREAYDWNAEFPNGGGRCSSCSTSPAPAAPWAVSRHSRATGSPTGAGSTASARSTARTSTHRRASPTTPAASTPRWSTRSPTCRSARSAAAPQTPGHCGRISRSATSPGPGCSSWPAASRWPPS